MNAHPNNRPSSGFTIIEVLIALTVLLIAVAGAGQMAAKAYRYLEITEQSQRVSYLASSHLQSLSMRELRTGVSYGAYAAGADQLELFWTLRLEQLSSRNMPDSNAGISDKVTAFRAELSVDLHDAERKVQFSTLLFTLPNNSNPAQQFLSDKSTVAR
jgi:prepilin-type N-terminal cleavage/methylation domain-containing protein